MPVLRDFSGCRINEAGFSGCDLRNAVFRKCDLMRATFIQNDLSGADFRTSFNYCIDPGANRMTAARFSYPEVLGLLDAYDIIVE